MLKSLGIWASCRLKKRSHSLEGKGDSQRKETLGRWREGASSAPELFPHTGHWQGERKEVGQAVLSGPLLSMGGGRGVPYEKWMPRRRQGKGTQAS